MITKKKNQKPIDLDIHLKYRCTNPLCEQDHWLSIKEAKTKNFKIVCDCGVVYKPKLIKTIKIIYSHKKKQKKPKSEKLIVERKQTPKEKFEGIDIDLLKRCVKVLIGYGFTEEESESLVKDSYTKQPDSDVSRIIKNVLESIGDKL